MTTQGMNVICIDTTAGFWDKGGFYHLAMLTEGEIEPIGVADMVSKIVQKIGNSKIRTLQIHGHGCPGQQGVAYSTSMDPRGGRTLLTDGAGNLAGEGKLLSWLVPYFLPRARIYLGGCNVAQGDGGARLLRAISRACSQAGKAVLTFASESWQNPWLPGYESIAGGRVRYSDGQNVLYTSYTGMD